jgi:PAS domain S-box-containing protein
MEWAAPGDGSARSDASSAEPITVLHVDDDRALGDLTREYLQEERERFEVRSETNVTAGLERLDADVDCVVSDYDMPERTGLEFLAAVRERDPDLPFVLFTGKGSEEIASEAISAGVTEYLQKETSPEQYTVLANRIENAVGKRRAERAFRRERESLNATLDALEDVFYVLDTDMTFVRWNERLEEVTGYEGDAVKEMSALEFFGEASDDLAAAVDRIVTERAKVTIEAPVVTKSGEAIPYEFTGAPVVDDGDLIGVCGIGRDLTTELASDRRHQRLIDSSPAPTVIIDAEGSVAYTNDAGVDLLNAGCPEDIVGESALSFVHPGDREPTRERIRKLIEDREPTEQAGRRLIGVEGGVHHVTIASAPVVFDGDPAAQVVMNDVTTEREQRRRLDQREEQLDTISSVVSHDMKGPINVAQGRFEMARETGEREHFQQVEDALGRIDEMTDDVGEMLNTRTVVDHEEPVDLATLVAEVERTLGDQDLTVEVVDSRELSADRGALKRLFENLLSNAARHAGADATVRVGTLAGGFFVADDGPGIDADDHGTVFEPGYTTDEDGSGYGLVSVRQIATAHGWDVRVTTSDAGGARFEFVGRGPGGD